MDKKVVRIPRAFVGLFVCGMLLLGLVGLGHAQPAQAALAQQPKPCITVTVPGTTVCIPLPSLPTITITKPVVTVTKKIPGKKPAAVVVTRTVTRERKIFQAPSTVTIRQPRPPRATVTHTTTAPAVTRTTTATVTTTRTDVRTVERERVVNLTKQESIGISLGLVILGALLAALILWLIYGVGYVNAEGHNVADLQKLRDELHN